MRHLVPTADIRPLLCYQGGFRRLSQSGTILLLLLLVVPSLCIGRVTTILFHGVSFDVAFELGDHSLDVALDLIKGVVAC